MKEILAGKHYKFNSAKWNMDYPEDGYTGPDYTVLAVFASPGLSEFEGYEIFPDKNPEDGALETFYSKYFDIVE